MIYYSRLIRLGYIKISYETLRITAALANSLILCYRYHQKFMMTSSPKTVLIIEDEADAAELFAEMMRVSGFHVVKTSSSTPAIHMMIANKPDVVILDIMMPEISGMDILRQMRSDPELSSIPVVVVSAKSMPADIKNGMEAGASTYITKPVGFLELKEAVERAIADNT
jgi:CheY-like chemotaxis protein